MPHPMTSIAKIIPLILAGVLFSGNLALAQETLTKDEIHTIIREYLIDHPEIMLEVQQALEAKQQAELAQTQQRTIEGKPRRNL